MMFANNCETSTDKRSTKNGVYADVGDVFYFNRCRKVNKVVHIRMTIGCAQNTRRR